MSYQSRVQYTGNGSIALYSIPFAYISKAYIEVRVGGSLLTEGAGFTWQSPTSIHLTAGNLGSGIVLDIRRVTPRTTKLVDFQDGSVLTEASLDLSNDQVFQLVQETLDDMQDRLAVQPDGTVDGQARRIANVALPVEAMDAVTKAYADQMRDAAVADVQAAVSERVTTASTSAAIATTQATTATSAASSVLAIAAAVTSAQDLAAAILGMNIGGSTVDANGHLIMTVTPAVTDASINAEGHLTFSY